MLSPNEVTARLRRDLILKLMLVLITAFTGWGWNGSMEEVKSVSQEREGLFKALVSVNIYNDKECMK